MKLHPKMYYLHPGQWPVFIGFTTSKKAFRHEMKRLKIKNRKELKPDAGSTAAIHYFTNSGQLCCIIYMPDHNRITQEITDPMYAALVAHEATHVVQEIRNELNQHGNFDAETEAYLIQYIVQECLTFAWYKQKGIRQIIP